MARPTRKEINFLKDSILSLMQVIYNELVLSEVKETVDKMVEDGLLYVSGHNEDGEPLFQLTELGKALRKELDNGK